MSTFSLSFSSGNNHFRFFVPPSSVNFIPQQVKNLTETKSKETALKLLASMKIEHLSKFRTFLISKTSKALEVPQEIFIQKAIERLIKSLPPESVTDIQPMTAPIHSKKPDSKILLDLTTGQMTIYPSCSNQLPQKIASLISASSINTVTGLLNNIAQNPLLRREFKAFKREIENTPEMPTNFEEMALHLKEIWNRSEKKFSNNTNLILPIEYGKKQPLDASEKELLPAKTLIESQDTNEKNKNISQPLEESLQEWILPEKKDRAENLSSSQNQCLIM